jgi:hypothetical protein
LRQAGQTFVNMSPVLPTRLVFPYFACEEPATTRPTTAIPIPHPALTWRSALMIAARTMKAMMTPHTAFASSCSRRH